MPGIDRVAAQRRKPLHLSSAKCTPRAAVDKLHLPSPLRYSDDLDYVRSTRSGIGPYLDALRRIAADVGLTEHGIERRADIVHVIFDTQSTDGLRRIRIRAETNVRETEPCFGRVRMLYTVESSWWSGTAEITTFDLDELIGNKRV